MSKSRRKYPSRIRLPSGESLVCVVARIQTRYENGMPEDVTLIPDDMTVELSDDKKNNQFMMVYVREAMLYAADQHDPK